MNSEMRDAIGALLGIILFLVGMGIVIFAVLRANDHNAILGLGLAVAGIYVGKAPR